MVCTELVEAVKQQISAVEQRRKMQLDRLERIHMVKVAQLEEQEKGIRQCMLVLEQTVFRLEASLHSLSGMEVIETNKVESDSIS